MPFLDDDDDDGNTEEAHGKDTGKRLCLRSLLPNAAPSDTRACLRSPLTAFAPPRLRFPPPPQEILEVEQVEDEAQGLELTAENVESVLDEIRPYLTGAGGGVIELEEIDGPIVMVHLGGDAANVMTVRVAITQKLREKIPMIAAVQLT